MNGSFDFGILIIGLGALAFVVGLGAWICECIKKPNAPDPSAKTLEDTLAPEIQADPSESPQLPELPTTPVTTLPSPLAQPAPIPPPPPPSLEIQEVELKQEHVDSDPSYEATQQIQFITPPQIPKTPKRTPPFPSLFSKLLKS